VYKEKQTYTLREHLKAYSRIYYQCKFYITGTEGVVASKSPRNREKKKPKGFGKKAAVMSAPVSAEEKKS
jgi:hypothetical protein